MNKRIKYILLWTLLMVVPGGSLVALKLIHNICKDPVRRKKMLDKINRFYDRRLR